MEAIRVELPDGSIREVAEGISVFEVARSISEGLARQSVAAKVDGHLVDVSSTLDRDCRLELITLNSEGRVDQ